MGETAMFFKKTLENVKNGRFKKTKKNGKKRWTLFLYWFLLSFFPFLYSFVFSFRIYHLWLFYFHYFVKRDRIFPRKNENNIFAAIWPYGIQILKFKMESGVLIIHLHLPIEIASDFSKKLSFQKAQSERFQTAYKSSKSDTIWSGKRPTESCAYF